MKTDTQKLKIIENKINDLEKGFTSFPKIQAKINKKIKSLNQKKLKIENKIKVKETDENINNG